MTIAYVAFGANLGDPADTFHRVARRLSAHSEVSGVRRSRLLRTAPVGGPEQADFLNGCFEFETSLDVWSLHALLKQIETEFGRTRSVHWGARTVDLDLALFDATIVSSPRLAVPHPRMHYRHFVLTPLAELDPDAVHPLYRLSVAELSRRAQSADRMIVLAGGEPAVTTDLLGRLREAGHIAEAFAADQLIQIVALGGAIAGVCVQYAPPVDATWFCLIGTQTRKPVERSDPPIVLPAADCRGDNADAVWNNLRTFLAALSGSRPGRHN